MSGEGIEKNMLEHERVSYLQGPLGELLPALWVPLDEGDVERGGDVPLLHVKQPLDHAMPRHGGVPGGSHLRRAPGVALGWSLGLAPLPTLLVLHLLAPQRHRHASVHLHGLMVSNMNFFYVQMGRKHGGYCPSVT